MWHSYSSNIFFKKNKELRIFKGITSRLCDPPPHPLGDNLKIFPQCGLKVPKVVVKDVEYQGISIWFLIFLWDQKLQTTLSVIYLQYLKFTLGNGYLKCCHLKKLLGSEHFP